MISRDQIEAVAATARAGKEIASNLVADLLDSCVETIDHYRNQTARWVETDRSGYHPYVVTDEESGKQVLVQIFTNDDGSIDLVQLAYRDDQWQSWSPPVEGVRG